MPIFWLSDDEISFPPPEYANEEGILAVGGDLSPERLLLAYQIGLFPWYDPKDPILWWSPDPRFVLFPKDLKVAKSMRPYFNQKKFNLTVDQHFETIVRACQKQRRKGQSGGTWISNDIVTAYTKLHQMGFAHSVEVWQNETIVGGLYGISLGKCFFGESMFSTVSNASKFALISLSKRLEELGFWMIDCQQATNHLKSMGGQSIPRAEFLDYMEKNKWEETIRGSWSDLGI